MSASFRTIGVDAPIEVEVFSDELHSLGPAEVARGAAQATRGLLAALDGEERQQTVREGVPE